METLKRKMEALISRRDDVMVQAKDVELHSSKKRKTEFDNWQSCVQKIEHDFKCFELKIQQSSNISRIGLSNDADKIHKEVEDLLDQGKFSEGILLNVNEEKIQPLVTTNMKGQIFYQSMRQVLLSLNGVSSIGIYGMGGVGKTTLAEHIHNHLLKDSRFSGNVYWVTVSQDFSITKLQSEIAKALKLDSTEDDDKKTAANLYQSLERKINFVLILDDVWTHFDVKKVGIPLDIGGGKLIITSRSLEVCDRIGCQKKVKVETLSMTESWGLFVETLDHNGDLPMEIEEIAKKMTKKCDGLPLGLITMAASMRGVSDVFEWRDAFEEFKESCMQMETMNDKVFPILCYSYNRLRDPRLQKCFLYCCLYPEDSEIERDELIQHFIVEGLLDRRNSRRAEFDQGHAVLNKLERACLLESVVNRNEKKKCLKMHDLVREMALQIARDEFKWMVKVGAQLHEVPGEQEWPEDLDKVALMNNDLKEVSLPLSHVHPRLTTLLLRGNCSLNQVVEPFFAQMPGLRVLDLSYTDIEKLPSSVSNLVSLSALLLQGCLKLRFVPPLNKLKNLIELDLYGTIIEEVPQGLENLVSLRSLDMRRDGFACLRSLDMRRDETTWTQAPVMKPAVDILARLSNLQSLSVPFVVRVEDLQGMRQLEILHGKFVDVCSFNRFVKYRQSCGKPALFAIALDPKQSLGWELDGLSKDNRVILKDLVLTGDNTEMLCHNDIGERGDVTLLPLDTQELLIWCCDFGSLDNSLLDAIPSLIHFKDLRHIQITLCNDIEFLFRLAEALPPVGTFSHLRCLEVVNCNKMKKLIPRWLLQYLLNLTEINAYFCSEMEEIITEDEEEQVNQLCASAVVPSNQSKSINDDEVILPNLQILCLYELPKLKSIYKGRMTCGSIRRIQVDDCPKLKKLPFTLPLRNGQPSAPPALEIIRINQEEWETLEWDHPQYKNVLLPFVRNPT